MKQRRLAKFLAFAFVTLSLGLFQNCGGKNNSDSISDSQFSDSLCGLEGFKLVHKNYFQPQCGSCHDKGGLSFPPFADTDVDTSYSWARTMDATKLWNNSINNPFCGPHCNLTTDNPSYVVLKQWLTCR